ncbi:MAG: mechanosensitive ion channel family protein [Phycisphaeraceae bacterium]
MRSFLIRLTFLCLLVGPAAANLYAQSPLPAGTDASHAETARAPEGADKKAASLIASFKISDLRQQNHAEQWLTLLAALFLGLVIGKIAQYFLSRLGQRLIDRKWDARGHLFADLANPASLALFTLGLTIGLSQLKMSTALFDFCEKTEKLLLSIAIFWYLYNLVSVIEVALTRLTAKTQSTLDDMLVPLLRKTLRIFLIVIATLFILDSIFEVNIGAWLAGLGIAGLAVSLAAQDSLKNLFGSFTIFLDQPFLVGSVIKYQGELGTIEEIGFRSTKLRTLDGSVITIPNSTIVNEAVENVGLRPYIKRTINVTITYDTPPEKIQQALTIIKEIFQLDGIREAIHDETDPLIPDKFPPRVYFNELNADSLNLITIYWHRPADYWQYLQHSERFNLELFKRFNEAGIDFAFPTQTLYLAGDEKRPLKIGTEARRDEGTK